MLPSFLKACINVFLELNLLLNLFRGGLVKSTTVIYQSAGDA